jgi:ribosomal protein S18 acetylase RimI-like enzyme
MMDAETISYSSPGPDRAEDLARLHVASWREAYTGMIPPDILADVDLADRTARWRSYLEAGGYPTFLASVAGEPAGFIRTGRLAEPLAEVADGHIYALYVLQRFHRGGIGRKLMGLAAAEWLQQGGRAFSLGVLTANQGARTFYEALGARFVRPDVYNWQGHNLPESIYVFENLSELARFA